MFQSQFSRLKTPISRNSTRILSDLSSRLLLLAALSVVDTFQRATSSVLLALSATRFSWALPGDQDVEGFDGQVYDIQVNPFRILSEQ